MSQIPEPWATAMVRAGMTDPRYYEPRPSMGRLAEAAGVHTTTVSRMVHGLKRPDPANVAAVAAALRLSPVEVSGWVNQARSVQAEYVPPAEVNLLTRREQDALSELIRSIAATREQVTGDGRDAPANTVPPVTVDDGTVIVPGESGKRSGGGSRGRRPSPARRGRDE